MVKRIINAINVVTRISALISGFMLSLLMVLNTYAVIRRYVFNSPVDWILDISEFLMVGAVFMGTAYILHIEGHVRVDLVTNMFSEKVRGYLYLVTMFFVMVFTAMLTWKTWQHAWDNLSARTDSISAFPVFPAHVVVFYGSLLLLLQSMIKLYSRLKG